MGVCDLTEYVPDELVELDENGIPIVEVLESTSHAPLTPNEMLWITDPERARRYNNETVRNVYLAKAEKKRSTYEQAYLDGPEALAVWKAERDRIDGLRRAARERRQKEKTNATDEPD